MDSNHEWKTVSNATLNLELDESEYNRKTQRRIKIRVPKQHLKEPVIGRLASDYDLDVNILAALLGSEDGHDGWFDLELQGKSQNIDSALTYLSDLDVEIWYESNQQTDDW